jgi:hypothetical protein
MQAHQRIEDLIEAGRCILDASRAHDASAQWKAQALDCLTLLFGPNHVYVSYLRESFGRGGSLGILSATGILDAAREHLTALVRIRPDRTSTQCPHRQRRRTMRIDYGPNFDEIRDSVENGTAVTFGNASGESLKCVVLDAKMDCESGRAALTVEEQGTDTVYFARYNYRGGRRSCGDLVTWRLKLKEMEELRRAS